MADLMRWDPFGEMLTLRQAMDRVLENAYVRGGESGEGMGAGLDLDLYEEDDELIVTAALPGVKPEDVDVTVQGNLLTIRGETREEQDTGRGRWHRRERRYGSFVRQIQLPVSGETEKAEARVENGILRLTLPKAEEARQRKIQVTSGGQEGQGGMPRKTQEIPVEGEGSQGGEGGRREGPRR